MWQQFVVDEVDEAVELLPLLQFFALPALRLVFGSGDEWRRIIIVRRSPIAPAVRRLKRRRKVRADNFGFFGFPLLALVKDTKEENLRQFRHVLQRACEV